MVTEDRSDKQSYWSTAVTQPRRVLCAYLNNWPIDLAVRRLGRASAAQGPNSLSRYEEEKSHRGTETQRRRGTNDGRAEDKKQKTESAGAMPLTPSPGTPGEGRGEGTFRSGGRGFSVVATPASRSMRSVDSSAR